MKLLVNIIYYLFNLYKLFVKTYYLSLYYFVKNKLYLICIFENGTKEIHTNLNNYTQCELAFIKQTIYNKNNFIEYYKRVYNTSQLNNNDLHNLKTKNNIMSIYVKINGKEYLIKNEQFNLLGNIILDKPFLKWYLYQHYNVKDIDNYIITILDNDVNLHELNNSNYILIEQDSFKIKTI